MEHFRADFSFAYPSRECVCVLEIRLSETGYVALQFVAQEPNTEHALSDRSMAMFDQWHCRFADSDPGRMAAQVLGRFFNGYAGVRYAPCSSDKGQMRDALAAWFIAARARREFAPTLASDATACARSFDRNAALVDESGDAVASNSSDAP